MKSSRKTGAKNEPGAAGDRGYPYGSHKNIATFSKPANHPRPESGSAADCEAGRKSSAQAGIEVRSRAAGFIPAVQAGLVGDCG